MSHYVPVANTSDIPPGEVAVVEADGRSLCVGHCEDGTWGAIDNVCTHDGRVEVDLGVATRELEIG